MSGSLAKGVGPIVAPTGRGIVEERSYQNSTTTARQAGIRCFFQRAAKEYPTRLLTVISRAISDD
jgi:hypothetical protein